MSVTTRPVLCAFEGSEAEPSTLAAEAAAWLAGALRAPLELVHVVDHDDLPALPPHGAGVDPLVRDALPGFQEQRAEDAARARLEATLAELGHGDATASVLTGWPPTVLRRHAVERDAALLVTGTEARQGFQRLLHGSIAASVAADAPCPVVVVPPDAALHAPGPVLVGDDGSEHGRRAVHHAEALAARIGRELARVRVEDREPAEALVADAHEQQACLAVVGTHGRGPLSDRLFGSVATGVVRTAGRPVMLVSAHAAAPRF